VGATDDEDGVLWGKIRAGVQAATVTVQVTGGSGKLDAWLDFNNDGDWTDPGEQILTSTSVVAGQNSLTFSVPPDVIVGTTFARFRLSTVGGLTPTGTADDGEVEDYSVTVRPVNTAPVIQAWDTLVAYTENSAPVILDDNVTLADTTSSNFNSGQLTVQLTTNVEAATDLLEILNQGENPGQVGVTLGLTNTVRFGGIEVGTYTSGPTLSVNWNANATVEAVQAVLRCLTFQTTSEDPSTLPRTVTVLVTDGDGGTSGLVSKTIQVTAVNNAPVISGLDAAIQYITRDDPILIAENAVLTDSDSPNFESGQLTLEIVNPPSTRDRLGIRFTGSLLGQISVNNSTKTISYSGLPIGTYQRYKNLLVITFNASATKTAVEKLIQSLTFSTSSPGTSARTVRVSVSDGDGGLSAAVTRTILVARRRRN
jgi:hypothetical protein